MTLKEWLIENGIKNSKVAEVLGLTPAGAGNLINAKYLPSISQTVALMEYTGLSVYEINPELAGFYDYMVGK